MDLKDTNTYMVPQSTFSCLSDGTNHKSWNTKNMDIYQKIFPTVGKTVIASNKKMQGKYVCFMSASFSNQNLQNKLVCL